MHVLTTHNHQNNAGLVMLICVVAANFILSVVCERPMLYVGWTWELWPGASDECKPMQQTGYGGVALWNVSWAVPSIHPATCGDFKKKKMKFKGMMGSFVAVWNAVKCGLEHFSATLVLSSTPSCMLKCERNHFTEVEGERDLPGSS